MPKIHFYAMIRFELEQWSAISSDVQKQRRIEPLRACLQNLYDSQASLTVVKALAQVLVTHLDPQDPQQPQPQQTAFLLIRQSTAFILEDIEGTDEASDAWDAVQAIWEAFSLTKLILECLECTISHRNEKERAKKACEAVRTHLCILQTCVNALYSQETNEEDKQQNKRKAMTCLQAFEEELNAFIQTTRPQIIQWAQGIDITIKEMDFARERNTLKTFFS